MGKVESTKREFVGSFWIPEFENESANGILTIGEAEDIEIFVINKLYNTNVSPVGFDKFDTVIGSVVDKSDNSCHTIVLYNVYQKQKCNSYISSSKYYAQFCLMGEPGSINKELLYKGLYLHSKELLDFVPVNGLDVKYGKSDRIFQVTIKYKQPKSIQLYNSDNYRIYFWFRAHHSLDFWNEFNLNESSWLNIDLKKGAITFKELIKLRVVMERLFMILWEKSHIFGQTDIRDSDKNNFSLHEHRERIYGPKKPKPNMDDFVRQFAAIWNNWNDSIESFEDIYDSFFFAFSEHNLDITNKFLNIVFALEQYHRRTVKFMEPLSRKNARMYEKVMAEVKSGDVKSWLDMFLNKEREISLKERIIELNELIAHEIDLGEDKLANDEIVRIVQTRNYHVHIDLKLKVEIFKNNELVKINDKLSILFFKLIKHRHLHYV